MKPAAGLGSKGIYIFHKNDKNLLVTREHTKFDEHFLETIGKSDYIIQSGVNQDPAISEIYPDSVNTCRIITENRHGSSRIIGAALRIGRGSNEVDNASAGGIFLKIDSNSGHLGDFARTYDDEKYYEHPDTHFVFRNFKILRWDEIRKFVVESTDKLPFFTYLGWDIALTS